MLFCGAQWDDDSFAAIQIVLNVWPTLKSQTNGFGVGCGARQGGVHAISISGLMIAQLAP
jgi:hypothetical protein